MTARRAPVYWRVLRLRQLRPRGLVMFVLFEGSVIVAGLLVLAEVVSAWALLAIPVAVAVMVKLNDVVAATLVLRPLAEAQLNAQRLRDRRAFGMSAVPGQSRLTVHIDRDDAVEDAAARPDAVEPAADPDRRPQPGARELESPAGPLPSVEPIPPANDSPRPDGGDRRNRGNQGRFDP